MLHALDDEKQHDPGKGDGLASDALDDAGVKKPHIRCPKCRWRPRKQDLWSCTCGCSWNTFDTRGVCPQCFRAWEHTQCLGCQQWSRHEDWYGQ